MSGKIGILFSGLGYETGTQLLEIPFIFREIERAGATSICLIPSELVPRAGRGKPISRRDLFDECAPLIRGEVIKIDDAVPAQLKGLIIPGGRGPITVLSDIAESGVDARIVRPVLDLIIGMHVRNKPIGSLGYGSALILVALKKSNEEPIVTLGDDAALIASLSALGIAPVNVGPQDVIFDEDNRLFSAAGISPGNSIAKGADGVEELTKSIVEFKEKKKR